MRHTISAASRTVDDAPVERPRDRPQHVLLEDDRVIASGPIVEIVWTSSKTPGHRMMIRSAEDRKAPVFREKSWQL
jgi:hypothetical protein